MYKTLRARAIAIRIGSDKTKRRARFPPWKKFLLSSSFAFFRRSRAFPTADVRYLRLYSRGSYDTARHACHSSHTSALCVTRTYFYIVSIRTLAQLRARAVLSIDTFQSLALLLIALCDCERARAISQHASAYDLYTQINSYTLALLARGTRARFKNTR